MSTFTDVLNAPNTAAATTTTGTSSTASMVSKDAFLKILMSQLKYQDPMDPMKADQFMTQLAQLTSVEQLTNIAGSLDTIKASMNGSTISQWTDLIGRQIKMDGTSGTDPFTGKTVVTPPTVSTGDSVVLAPSGDYDKVVLKMKTVSTGAETTMEVKKGETLTLNYTGKDDVKVTAYTMKGNAAGICTATVYRTVIGLQSTGNSVVAVTAKGDQYNVNTIKQIIN
jgi:flagellar basal-body rod modification protein FlgD